MTWTQVYDPFHHWWLSTLVAALPVLVLLGLLAGFKVKAHLCAIAGALTAIVCAIFVFGMPAKLAVTSFVYGTAFGLLKIVWIVIAAVFLYDISVATGQFEIMKHSVAAHHAGPPLAAAAGRVLFRSVYRRRGGIRHAGGDRRRIHDRSGLQTVSRRGAEFDRQYRAGGVGRDWHAGACAGGGDSDCRKAT